MTVPESRSDERGVMREVAITVGHMIAGAMLVACVSLYVAAGASSTDIALVMVGGAIAGGVLRLLRGGQRYSAHALLLRWSLAGSIAGAVLSPVLPSAGEVWRASHLLVGAAFGCFAGACYCVAAHPDLFFSSHARGWRSVLLTWTAILLVLALLFWGVLALARAV